MINNSFNYFHSKHMNSICTYPCMTPSNRESGLSCNINFNSSGLNGYNGAPGPKGNRGAPGYDGVPGLDGVDGRPGPKGNMGAPGYDGVPGVDGKDGYNGIPGAKGEMGKIIKTLVGGCRHIQTTHQFCNMDESQINDHKKKQDKLLKIKL